MKNINRREFLFSVTGLGLLAALAPKFVQAQERRRGGGAASAPAALKECAVSDPAMKNLGYVSTHSQVKDANQKVSRSGVDFDKQFCNACMFYQGKPTDKLAKCQLAPTATCGVAAKGWCSSWAKKA